MGGLFLGGRHWVMTRLSVSVQDHFAIGWRHQVWNQDAQADQVTSAVIQGREDDPAGGTTYQPVHPIYIYTRLTSQPNPDREPHRTPSDQVWH